jgi:hypothetical protein
MIDEAEKLFYKLVKDSINNILIANAYIKDLRAKKQRLKERY